MKEETISRIAVVMLAIILAVFGMYHLMNPYDLVVYIPSFLPKGAMPIYIVGVSLILAAVALITHRQVKLAGYMLAILLIVFVLTIHLPNYLGAGDKELRQAAFLNLLKDSAIAAFAMYIASNAKKL